MIWFWVMAGYTVVGRTFRVLPRPFVSLVVELEGAEVDFQGTGGVAVDFEWDPDKADANIAKHGVSFFDAAEVFGDVLSSTFSDPDTSVGEDRYLIFGQTQRGAHLVVSFTDRGDTIRLISARQMTARERVAYEEG